MRENKLNMRENKLNILYDSEEMPSNINVQDSNHLAYNIARDVECHNICYRPDHLLQTRSFVTDPIIED